MSLVHGIDSNSKVIPLLLDASGNIIVSASQITTTGGKFHVDANGDIIPDMDSITTTGGKVKLDSSGRVIVDGDEPSLLRPSPKSSSYANTNLSAGSYNLTIVTVPAGETWRLTMVSVQYVGTVAGLAIYWYIYTGSAFMQFGTTSPVASGVAYFATVNVLLDSGWSIVMGIGGATAGDDFYVAYFAERVY